MKKFLIALICVMSSCGLLLLTGCDGFDPTMLWIIIGAVAALFIYIGIKTTYHIIIPIVIVIALGVGLLFAFGVFGEEYKIININKNSYTNEVSNTLELDDVQIAEL